MRISDWSSDVCSSDLRLSGLSVRDAATPEGDIEIVEVGLRPGEKLYEELLIGDNPAPTVHLRIMQAREAVISWNTLRFTLNNLNEYLTNGDTIAAIDILREIGRASSRGSVCQYVMISWVAVSLKKHTQQ